MGTALGVCTCECDD